MSKSLIEKLRRAREFNVPVDGHTFTARRPTDAELLELKSQEPIQFVRRFVVGWDLVELDVIPGGGPEPVAFDPDLWCEWIADRSDYWEPLATAIFKSYREFAESRRGAEKNS